MGIQRITKDKRGLQFKNAFFALIVVGVIITAAGTIVSEWAKEYNSGLVYDLNEEYNQLDSVSGTADEQQGKLTPNEISPGTDFEANTFRGVYGIISNIYSPFRVVFGEDGMIDDLSERFGLPGYIGNALVAMMVLAITFALVAIIFRLGRTSA